MKIFGISFKSFLYSIYKILNNIIHCNNLIVDYDEYKRRLKICDNCELIKKSQKKYIFFIFKTNNASRCSECGCFIDWKARLICENCEHPKIDKWKI